jgi:hypothetical protein
MQQKENSENKEVIKKLQESLQKKDEELEALTAEEMEEIDVTDDYSGEPENSSTTRGDGEQGKGEKSNETDNGGGRNKKKKVVMKSIENRTGMTAMRNRYSGAILRIAVTAKATPIPIPIPRMMIQSMAKPCIRTQKQRSPKRPKLSGGAVADRRDISTCTLPVHRDQSDHHHILTDSN